MTTQPDAAPEPSSNRTVSADWAAVIVAAVIVLMAISGVLPSIPFLVK